MEQERTKALRYLASKEKRTVWLRAFHIWQRRPHEVDPLSEDMHVCSSCQTAYQGNYCPRCGQSARVGRFSFKKALLLFLDVWGLGNRSMFRSIRDLILRPGYMIRDYLGGMQSAYFPPFKMFFLLTAFSLLVNHDFHFIQVETGREVETKVAEMVEEDEDETGGHFSEDDEVASSPMYELGVKFADFMDMLREKNPTIFALLSLVMFAIPLYFFLRHSPTIPDLRYSEFVVALVYTSNTFSICSIAGNLLGSNLLRLVAVLMAFVALRQFSGYSMLRLLGYIILTFLISMVVLSSLVGVGIFVAYLYYGN